VDGSQQYKEGRNQNELLNEHIEQIVQAYDEEQDVDKFMRMVEMEEIEENDYNLNISRYIDTTEPEPEVDLVAVRKEINKLEDKENEIDERLNQYLEELGL
jgi:type I restriction enzyme M protein